MEFARSISHGTLRLSDLLRSFALELESSNAVKHAGIIDDARYYADELDADNLFVTDCACGCLDEIDYELQAYAPDGYYFGAHEGDGSDFGYWPIDAEELDDAVTAVRFELANSIIKDEADLPHARQDHM